MPRAGIGFSLKISSVKNLDLRLNPRVVPHESVDIYLRVSSYGATATRALLRAGGIALIPKLVIRARCFSVPTGHMRGTTETRTGGGKPDCPGSRSSCRPKPQHRRAKTFSKRNLLTVSEQLHLRTHHLLFPDHQVGPKRAVQL